MPGDRSGMDFKGLSLMVVSSGEGEGGYPADLLIEDYYCLG